MALVSVVQLGFEMLVIKLGRYELGSLAIGTIGLAILGVSLAGPLTSWLGGPARASSSATAMLLPLSIGAGAYFFSRPHAFHDEAQTHAAMLACGALALLLLAFASVPVFAALREHPADVSRVYSASLVGATLGAPLVLAAMQWAGDVGAYAAVVALVGASAIILATNTRRRVFVATLAALAVAGCVIGFPMLDRRAHPGARLIETDATSRIDVYESGHGRLQIRTAGVNAGTSTAGGTVETPRSGLLGELPATAFRLRPRSVLMLGSGAGKNVVQGLAFGAARIVAVEINPMIPRALERLLAREQDPYRDARVTLMVDEGREAAAALAHDGATFDLVYVPIATLFGSSGHTFTETYLMTREAFVQYAGALAPRGVIAVYFPDIVRAKVVGAMAKALEDFGVEDLPGHMVVVERGHAFVSLARVDVPFTPAERARIVGADVEGDVARDIVVARTLRPLSDDNPFLYNDLWSARGMRSLFGWNMRFLRQAYLAALVVLGLAVVFTASRNRELPIATRVGTLAAFVLMGIGYTAHQTLVLQRLAFLVGHPVIATAIVLPMTLLGSALGARLWARVPESRVGVVRAGCFALLVASAVPLVLVAPKQFVAPGVPTALRMLMAAGLAMIPFVPLGTYFPAAFGRLERDAGALAASAWLVNGIGAVIGSILAIYAPMLFGFRSTVVFTFAAYAILSTWDAYATRSTHPARTHLGVACSALLLVVTSTALIEAVTVGARAE